MLLFLQDGEFLGTSAGRVMYGEELEGTRGKDIVYLISFPGIIDSNVIRVSLYNLQRI